MNLFPGAILKPTFLQHTRRKWAFLRCRHHHQSRRLPLSNFISIYYDRG